METQADKFIGVSEICRQIDCGRTQVYKLFNTGKLVKVKHGKSTKSTQSSVQALIKSGVLTGKV